MDVDHIDIDLLIDEIEKRPVLWNMECSDYKNRSLKKSYWDELAELFGRSDDSKEKKKLLSALLQKKWRSVRDNFARELKKQKCKSESSVKKRGSYIYFTRLRFLESAVSHKDISNSFDSNTSSIVNLPDSAQCDLQAGLNGQEPHTPRTVRKMGKVQPIERDFADILTNSFTAREQKEVDLQNQDEDRLFCLSLYKELTKVPERGRLQTKIELLEVIQRAQEFHSHL